METESGGRMKPWDPKVTMKLITMLKSAPELWKLNSEQYRNKELKEKTLGQFAKSLGRTVDDIRRKLHNLRCQMNSEIRKSYYLKSKGKDADRGDKTWEFYDALKFMKSPDATEKPVTPTAKTARQIAMNLKRESSVGNSGNVNTPSPSPRVVLKTKRKSSTSVTSAPPSKRRNSRVQNSKTVNETAPKAVNKTKPKTVYQAKPKTLSQTSHVKSRRTSDSVQEPLVMLRESRDDCDVFGEFIAVELKQIRSLERRRRLKRSIQLLIMQMGEEEDNWDMMADSNTSGNKDLLPLAEHEQALEGDYNENGNLTATDSNLKISPGIPDEDYEPTDHLLEQKMSLDITLKDSDKKSPDPTEENNDVSPEATVEGNDLSSEAVEEGNDNMSPEATSEDNHKVSSERIEDEPPEDNEVNDTSQVDNKVPIISTAKVIKCN